MVKRGSEILCSSQKRLLETFENSRNRLSEITVVNQLTDFFRKHTVFGFLKAQIAIARKTSRRINTLLPEPLTLGGALVDVLAGIFELGDTVQTLFRIDKPLVSRSANAFERPF